MRLHVCQLLDLRKGWTCCAVSNCAIRLTGMGMGARVASFRWSLFLVSMWSC